MTLRPARLLWLVAGLLAIGLAAELALGGDALPPNLAPAPSAARDGTAPAEPVPAWVATALDRPLFTPGRRPPAPGTRVAGAPAGRAEPPRLTGIMLSAAGRRAIFAPPAEADPAIVVGEGGSVGPWRVEAIRAGDVQLSGPGGRRLVRPAFSDKPVATATPGPAGAQLPPLPQTDTKPFSLTPQSSGAAILLNAPAGPAPRTPR